MSLISGHDSFGRRSSFEGMGKRESFLIVENFYYKKY